MQMKLYNFQSRIILFLFCFSFFSCESKGIKVKGTLKNTQGSKYIYLFKYFGPEISKMDSVKVEDQGSFTFHFDKPLQRGFYRIGLEANQSFLIILSNENPIVEGDILVLEEVKISESKENEIYKK